MKLCRFLRWKGLYGVPYTDASQALEVAARNDVPFSCLQTTRPWGPDDEAATPECCGPDRACFREAVFRSDGGGPSA